MTLRLYIGASIEAVREQYGELLNDLSGKGLSESYGPDETDVFVKAIPGRLLKQFLLLLGKVKDETLPDFVRDFLKIRKDCFEYEIVDKNGKALSEEETDKIFTEATLAYFCWEDGTKLEFPGVVEEELWLALPFLYRKKLISSCFIRDLRREQYRLRAMKVEQATESIGKAKKIILAGCHNDAVDYARRNGLNTPDFSHVGETDVLFLRLVPNKSLEGVCKLIRLAKLEGLYDHLRLIYSATEIEQFRLAIWVYDNKMGTKSCVDTGYLLKNAEEIHYCCSDLFEGKLAIPENWQTLPDTEVWLDAERVLEKIFLGELITVNFYDDAVLKTDLGS